MDKNTREKRRLEKLRRHEQKRKSFRRHLRLHGYGQEEYESRFRLKKRERKKVRNAIK
jgi:hypothetical protein